MGALFTVLLGFLIILIPCESYAENSVNPGCPIQFYQPSQDTIIEIPIYFSNDVNLRKFTLGLEQNCGDVEITAISTEGTVVPIPEFFQAVFHTHINQVLVGWQDHTGSNPITPQEGGLMFTLSMEVPTGTDPQCIDIDSTFVTPAGPFLFTPESGGSITPDYYDCDTCDLQILILPGPPVVDDIPDQTVTLGNPFSAISLDDYVDDPDHADDEIAWSYSGNNELDITIDGNRVATINVPSQDWHGSETIMFTATDPDSFYDSDAAAFTAVEGNIVYLGCPIEINIPVEDTTIEIPVYFSNEVDLGSILLGFIHNSDEVETTSMSTAGTVVPNPEFFDAVFWHDDNQVLIGWTDYTGSAPIIPQDSGLIFTLLMEVPAGVSSQIINIDSAFIPPAGYFVFTPAGGSTDIIPDYYDCSLTDIIIGTSYVCGDADGSGIVEISDAVFLISYIFVPGSPTPDPLASGDPDCSGVVEISDVVFLIAYIFVPGSPEPCDPDGDGIPDC